MGTVVTKYMEGDPQSFLRATLLTKLPRCRPTALSKCTKTSIFILVPWIEEVPCRNQNLTCFTCL